MSELIDLISQNTESTVIAEYERPEMARETGCQTEADLEREFIAQLQRQGYEYLPIHSEKELIENLRRQIERLIHTPSSMPSATTTCCPSVWSMSAR